MWLKSNRCESNSCVEVQFRKSTKSVGGNCVEVGETGDQVQVRDSKDQNGPVLTFTKDEWRAFVGGVKDNEFDI